MSAISIPKTVKEALAHPGWRQALIAEMNALESSSAWKLVPLLMENLKLVVDGSLL